MNQEECLAEILFGLDLHKNGRLKMPKVSEDEPGFGTEDKKDTY